MKKETWSENDFSIGVEVYEPTGIETNIKTTIKW